MPRGQVRQVESRTDLARGMLPLEQRMRQAGFRIIALAALVMSGLQSELCVHESANNCPIPGDSDLE